MAATYGSWEYAGGNGMRVGIDATAESISHTETQCTFTIKIYTDNQYTYADNGEKLSYGYDIDGTKTYNNQNGSSAVLRDTKTYNYNYSSTSYGSSPGTARFSAAVSGTYNGVTPRHEVTVAIPARPYAAPAPPTACTATRVSDTSITAAWTRNATTGEPYSALWLERFVYGYETWARKFTLAGTATSQSDTTVVANRKYAYRVQADNSVGTSTYAQSGDVYTTPDAPTSPVRTQSGTNQVLTWALAVGYTEYATEVWRAVNGTYSLLATVAAGVTTYTDTTSSSATQVKYKLRTKTTVGTALYSAYSAETTQTAGVLSAPTAPTAFKPSTGTVDPSNAIQFTWTHNPTDGSAQSAYLVQYRYVGDSTWIQTAKIISTVSSWTMPANTVAKGRQVEWQVATWGASASLVSPFSATATWTTSPIVAVKYPLFLDVTSGRTEADSTWKSMLIESTVLLTNADPITKYPIGESVYTLTTAQATAGGWIIPASGTVHTIQRADGLTGHQWYYRNSSTLASTMTLWRQYNNTTGWGPWRYMGAEGAEIGSGVDLNTLITAPGSYVQSQSAEATLVLNYPAPVAGVLEVLINTVDGVLASNLLGWQRYTSYNHGTYPVLTWIRSVNVSTWSPWTLISGDTAWIEGDAAIFTADSGAFTLSGAVGRRIGRMVQFNMTGVMKVAVGNPTSGNVTNTTVGAVTAAWRPDQTQPYPAGLEQSLGTVASGRAISWSITGGGSLKICAIGGTSDLAVGETVSCSGMYFI